MPDSHLTPHTSHTTQTRERGRVLTTHTVTVLLLGRFWSLFFFVGVANGSVDAGTVGISFFSVGGFCLLFTPAPRRGYVYALHLTVSLFILK